MNGKVQLTKKEKDVLTVFVNKCIQARAGGHKMVCWNEIRGMICVRKPVPFLFEGVEKKEMDSMRRAFKRLIEKGLIEIEKRDKVDYAYILPDILSQIEVVVIQRNPSLKKEKKVVVKETSEVSEENIQAVVRLLRQKLELQRAEVETTEAALRAMDGLRVGLEVLKKYSSLLSKA